MNPISELFFGPLMQPPVSATPAPAATLGVTASPFSMSLDSARSAQQPVDLPQEGALETLEAALPGADSGVLAASAWQPQGAELAALADGLSAPVTQPDRLLGAMIPTTAGNDLPPLTVAGGNGLPPAAAPAADAGMALPATAGSGPAAMGGDRPDSMVSATLGAPGQSATSAGEQQPVLGALASERPAERVARARLAAMLGGQPAAPNPVTAAVRAAATSPAGPALPGVARGGPAVAPLAGQLDASGASVAAASGSAIATGLYAAPAAADLLSAPSGTPGAVMTAAATNPAATNPATANLAAATAATATAAATNPAGGGVAAAALERIADPAATVSADVGRGPAGDPLLPAPGTVAGAAIDARPAAEAAALAAVFDRRSPLDIAGRSRGGAESAAGGTAGGTADGADPLLTGAGDSTESRVQSATPRPVLPVLAARDLSALAERIDMLVHRNLGRANVSVNLAELGDVEIRVRMESRHAHVQFVVQDALARDALEAQLPRLRALLADAGLNLGDVAASLQERSQGGAEGNSASTPGRDTAPAVASVDPAEVAPESRRRTGDDHLIDAFA